MYKLLIVDDEPLVQVGIKSLLNWNALGIEVIDTAVNGKVALDIINEQHPDIVLTDIKMPVIDGIELIKRCRETFGSSYPHFIILTSYEEFSLARQAIAYGASDYLVKIELTADSLKDSVSRVLDDLKSSENSAPTADTAADSFRDKFFIRLLNNLFESAEQFELQSRELGLNFEDSSYRCCTGFFSGINVENRPADIQLSVFTSSLQMLSELAEKYMLCHCIALDMRHFAVIFCGSESAGHISQILASIRETLTKYYNVSFSCGIGQEVSNALVICDSYQGARLALMSAEKTADILCIDDMAYDRNLHDAFNMSIFKESLTKAFEEYDSEELKHLIDSLCTLFGEHPSNFVQALDAASNILYLSISLLQNGEQELDRIFGEYPDGYRSLYRQNTVSQIIRWLGCLGAGLSELFDEHRRDRKNHIVTGVKKYVADNIREKLTLNQVAAAFGISPNYLSQLFSKYSDMGFSEYVNFCKIRESKKLLDTGHYKVYEVADMLGFESSFYFSKVFKKLEGIAPTEYINH